MLTQVKQANRRRGARAGLSRRLGALCQAGQGTGHLRAPFQFVAIGPTEAFFAKAVGAASAEGVVTIAPLDAAPRVEGLAGVLRRLQSRSSARRPTISTRRWPGCRWRSWRHAVAKAGLDKEKIRATIASDTFETINGKVRFDGVQNAITPTAFVQIQKGKLQLVWPKSIATGKYEPKKGW